MQIQKINNNSNNTNFYANLKIKGYIEDISSKQIKAWENKAKTIGREVDILELEFGEPINIDIKKQLPKPINPQYEGNWKSRVWRLLGVYPKSDAFFIAKRNINASIIFADNMDKKLSKNIGYWSDYYTKVEDADIQKWHTETTNTSVNEYLKKLKRILRKGMNPDSV